MVQTREKTIDGVNVKVTQHPGLRSVTLHVRIIKLLGVPVSTLIFSAVNDKKTISLSAIMNSGIDMPTAMAELCERLDPQAFESLLLETLSMTHLNDRGASQKEVFDDVFSGNLLLMYKVLFFVLEVNFGDFFKAVGSGLTSAPEPTINRQQSGARSKS